MWENVPVIDGQRVFDMGDYVVTYDNDFFIDRFGSYESYDDLIASTNLTAGEIAFFQRVHELGLI